MRRRELLVGGGTAAVAALAGCLGAQAEEEPTARSGSRTITVRASGEVESEPNQATFEASVEATGENAPDVRDDLARRSEEVRQALLDAGLAEDQVRTGQFSVRQRIDRERAEREGVDPREAENDSEFVYFQGSHSLTVEVDDVDAVGELVDVAVDAGADEISRIAFGLSENRRATLREVAIEEALSEARDEASFIADEIGASVSQVKRVDTTDEGVSPYYEDVAMEAADDGAPTTEIHPGDVTVSASVEVTYSIE